MLNKNSKNKQFLFGLITGVFIGLIVGLLLQDNMLMPLSSREMKCLLDTDGKHVLISNEQAMCLARVGRAKQFYGVGNPFFPLDGYVRIKLTSGNMVMTADTDGLQDELEDKGVYRVRK